MRKQITASRAKLFLGCQYPFGDLPELPHDEGSETSEYGNAFHWVISHYSMKRGQPPMDLEKQIDHAVKKWKLRRSAVAELPGHVRISFQVLYGFLSGKNAWGINFRPGGFRVEQSAALSLRGAEVTIRKTPPPTEEDHIYPDLKKREIGMTIDLSVEPGRENSDAPSLVLDHKTGSAEDYSKPEENPQLLTMAPSVYGPDRILAILHADRRGLPEVHAEEVGQDAVDRHVARLRRAMKRVGDGSMTPGPWCRYCPVKPVCPAAAGSIVVAVSQLMQGVGESGLPNTPGSAIVRALDEGLATADDVGRLHYFSAEFRKLDEQGKKLTREWVREHPQEDAMRPDGKRLTFQTYEEERLSKSRILEIMGAEYAEKLFNRLRRRGALEKKTVEKLVAVDDD